MSNFDVMLSTQSSGHLSIRDEDGTIAPIEVNIISSGDEFILIKPKDSDKCIQPGMSGSTFLVNGASAGILLSVDTDTCEGKVMRKDVIMRLTEPFFIKRQTEADKSIVELDKIAEKLASRGLNCKGYWCGFNKTRLREYVDNVSKIYLGNSVDNLRTIIDVKALIEEGSEGSGYVPIISDTNKFFMKVLFNDGTFSRIKEIIPDEKSDWTSTWTFKELELIETTSKIKTNPVYAVFKPKINKLVIWPGSLLNTENVLFSFDDGGYFEQPKPNNFDGPYSLFEIDFKMTSPYIKLAYKLSNKQEIGEFKYKIEGIKSLVQEAYKKKFNTELENTFNCYKIPVYKENPDYKTKSENPDAYKKRLTEALESQMITKQLEQLGYIIPKNDKAKIVCLNKANMRTKNSRNTTNYFNHNLLSVKEIRFGTNTNDLNKIVPIKLDVKRVIDVEKPQDLYLYDHKLTETLMVEFSSEVKTIYAQLTYFDGTKSRIVRLIVNEEFNPRNY